MIRALLLILALLCPVAAAAQSEALDLLTNSLPPVDPPTTDAGIAPTQDIIDAYNAAQVAYYSYRTDQLVHRLDVFKWQYLSSQAIFAVVIAVVAVGLYFSWMQFHASNLGRDLGRSDIEASEKGVKISSPVLGVIILALSLGFFYLYLVHVYPISEIF
ncbi:hypothetical protein [Jannaschia donghaensis]|uniref:Uncharacterized protein n=1 Tax=Jannaschia donghaensis TaxID=420998 RepID=A0A0M6YPA6_9RHOB|nr:hypothetical protein [Jannaschia donghaensis]CTQ50846.1 hypothetical protein JDO7802_02877 [Jannaschia donghaensis]